MFNELERPIKLESYSSLFLLSSLKLWLIGKHRIKFTSRTNLRRSAVFGLSKRGLQAWYFAGWPGVRWGVYETHPLGAFRKLAQAYKGHVAAWCRPADVFCGKERFLVLQTLSWLHQPFPDKVDARIVIEENIVVSKKQVIQGGLYARCTCNFGFEGPAFRAGRFA